MVPASPMPTPRHLPAWLAPSVLVIAVVLAYANALYTPFLFDDLGAVVENPTIRHLGSSAVFRPPADGSTTTGRPVVNVSFAVNHALSGENVWSYHALNVAIHALAALLLFGLVGRTLRSHRVPAAAGLAIAVALVWALHPLQTESVTSIAQRTESLCGLFFIAVLYGLARAPSRVALAFSVVACALGMATKEVMVSAPLVALLYDRTFLAGSFSAAWRARRGYYLALGATWLVLAVLVTGARGASAGFGLGVGSWHYLLRQSEAIMLYLRLSLWPYPLVFDYGTGVMTSLAEVLWPSLAVLALLGVTGWALVRRPILGFFGAVFFLILAPSSSVVPLVTQTVAEHRMYLPLAAVVVVAAFALVRLLGGRAIPVLVALGIAGGAVTAARNRDYRSAIAIWTDTVAKRPGNPRAHNNLALALEGAGRTAEAETHYARAVALDPAYVSARYNWGVALLAQHRDAAAMEQFAAALRLAPDHADAALNLGNALVRLRRPLDAIAAYEFALRLRPAADAHYNLGVALAAAGRETEAATQFRAGLVIAPEHIDAHRRVGLLEARGGDAASAESHFRAVVRLAPADADAPANLGNVLLLQGRAREAIAAYEASLRLRPGDARTLENLQIARDALR